VHPPGFARVRPPTPNPSRKGSGILKICNIPVITPVKNVYAPAQIKKVPGNYNWNTKNVQINNKKRVKKWDPLLDVLIPKLFDDLQSDT
jgi:hypothetical protein